MSFSCQRHLVACKHVVTSMVFGFNRPCINIPLTRHLGVFSRTPSKENEQKLEVKSKEVVRVKQFFDEYASASGQDKKRFIDALENYQNLRRVKRFGYSEFVGAALPAMKEFGVEKDLEAYKSLMRIFPAGAFVPSSKLASGFYPHVIQQRAALDILCQMEKNRLIPDKEMESIIVASFSRWSQVWQKCARMTYWLTKLANANPFPFPEKLPDDALDLAIVALKRMSVDPQADVTVYSTTQIDDQQEDTWICFSQSESQCKLIQQLDQEKYSVSLDGPFQVWVEHHSVTYFVLIARDITPKANVEDKVEVFLRNKHEKNDVSDIPLSNFGHLHKKEALEPMRQVHEQEDGTILALVATQDSSQQSLVAFIRFMEKENPRLLSIPVILKQH